jgi:vitamin B12 transporter
MPTFTELYVNNSFLRSNPNLLPETGWSYETGLKISYPDADLKVALYYMNITDKIAYLKQGAFSYAQNFQKFKNTGLETHYERRLNEHWRYDIGGSYSNPLQAGDDGVYTSVFNRLQLTGGLTYMQDRWTTRLSADYLAMRANDLKPMLPVSLAISYKMSPASSWILNIDNLFDRRDITTNDKVTATAPAYYAMPRSFRLTYNSKF